MRKKKKEKMALHFSKEKILVSLTNFNQKKRKN